MSVSVSAADCNNDAVACDDGVDSSTQATEVIGQDDTTDQGVMNVDSVPQDCMEGDATVLIDEQKGDPTLASCWYIRECCTTVTKLRVRVYVSSVCLSPEGLV